MIQPVQFTEHHGVLRIDTGPYKGDKFGMLECCNDGTFKVYDHGDAMDFWTESLSTALYWAAGNAYRYVAHRMKNG